MKRAERQPETISITIYGGIYYKVWTVPDAGTLVPQHAHEFDHLTAIIHGKVHVMTSDGDFVKQAPDTILIPAHLKHSFLTLTDNVVLACIHNANRAEANGEPIVASEHQLELED